MLGSSKHGNALLASTGSNLEVARYLNKRYQENITPRIINILVNQDSGRFIWSHSLLKWCSEMQYISRRIWQRYDFGCVIRRGSIWMYHSYYQCWIQFATKLMCYGGGGGLVIVSSRQKPHRSVIDRCYCPY